MVPLDQFGNQNIPLPISMSKSKFTIAFPSNTGHISINWYEAISTINPFKQPKCALESKLLNFKNFANCKIFVCLPTGLPAWPHHPQKSTYLLNSHSSLTSINLFSILSHYEVYFYLHEPFLFLWCLLSSSVSWLFLVDSA